MSKRIKKILISILSMVSVLVLLSACSSGRQREEVAQQKFQAIPEVPGSVVVRIVSGIAGGSSETCYGGYVDALYGTSASKSDIIAFYREYTQDEHWIIKEEFNTDLQLFASNRQEDYGLAVIVLTPIGPTEGYYPSAITKKDIEQALSKFNTAYLVLVSYYPGNGEC